MPILFVSDKWVRLIKFFYTKRRKKWTNMSRVRDRCLLRTFKNMLTSETDAKCLSTRRYKACNSRCLFPRRRLYFTAPVLDWNYSHFWRANDPCVARVSIDTHLVETSKERPTIIMCSVHPRWRINFCWDRNSISNSISLTWQWEHLPNIYM